MKNKSCRYFDKSFEVSQAIREVYYDYFKRRPQHHSLTWDFERATGVFGKDKIVALHLYSDCPGVLIGYQGKDYNALKEKVQSIIPGIEIKIHDCEHF